MCRRRRGGSHEEAALGSPPAAHWKAITVVFPGRVVPAFFSSFFFSACPLSNSLGKRLSGNIMIIFRLPALLSLCDGPRGISNVNGLLIGFLPRQAPVLNDDARPGAASCSPFSLSLFLSLSRLSVACTLVQWWQRLPELGSPIRIAVGAIIGQRVNRGLKDYTSTLNCALSIAFCSDRRAFSTTYALEY